MLQIFAQALMLAVHRPTPAQGRRHQSRGA